jgi:hypothetical protein
MEWRLNSMANLPCPDCNSQISTRAFVCPVCGSPRRIQRLARALLWLIAIGIGIALMGLAAAILHLNFR